jgi:hypothetical protein
VGFVNTYVHVHMCSSYLQFPVFYRITVANADLAMARGETDTALNILRTVGPEQPYYIQANAFMYTLGTQCMD